MKSHFQKYLYIAVTIFSSAVGFIKSYLFMDLLSKKDLGYIAIFQSIMVVIGFLQIGCITGGYRLISFSKDRYKKANDAVLTYLFCLCIAILGSIVIFSLLTTWNWFLILGIFVGIATLLTNWWTNLHIGLGRNRLLSILTFCSVVISLAGIPALHYDPLYGAILLIALQPLAFIVLSFVFNKDFKFRISLGSRPIIKLIIKYGFVPFFVGILYYINQQAERWIIGYSLSIEALGEYYLVFVFTTVFAVVPTALATINFPGFMKAIRNNNDGQKKFVQVFGRYYIELFAYIAVMAIGIYLIMPLAVEKFLPKHVAGVHYVKIIFWGLCVYILVDPVTFILNARLHYRELVIIYVMALICSLSSYAYLHFSRQSSLSNFAWVNVLFLTTVSVGYVIYYILKGYKALYQDV